MGALLKSFLSLCFVLWFITLSLWIWFWDNICKCLIANVENVEEFEWSIMHVNHEEGEVTNFYFSSPHHVVCLIIELV